MNLIKRHMVGGLILSAALFLSGCAADQSSGELTNKGYEALEEQDYQQALTLFQGAAQSKENKMLAYRGLGMTYMGLADYAAAEEVFLAAVDLADVKMKENLRDLQLYLATAQFRQGKYDETIDTCNTILENWEDGVKEAYYLRGASCLKEGLVEDAAASFDKAVELGGDDYDLYLNIYECYKEQNLSGIGGQYLQSALNIQGEDMEHAYNRGRVYYYLENYDKAQSLLIGPVEQEYEPAMFLIGKVYLAQHDIGHAEDIYEKIEAKFGTSIALCNAKALCMLEKKDYNGALTLISNGLSMEGTMGKQELYFNEIVVFERMEDFAMAKIKAKEYVERYPADVAGQKEWEFLATR